MFIVKLIAFLLTWVAAGFITAYFFGAVAELGGEEDKS